jgi:hypothetical protein
MQEEAYKRYNGQVTDPLGMAPKTVIVRPIGA